MCDSLAGWEWGNNSTGYLKLYAFVQAKLAARMRDNSGTSPVSLSPSQLRMTDAKRERALNYPVWRRLPKGLLVSSDILSHTSFSGLNIVDGEVLLNAASSRIVYGGSTGVTVTQEMCNSATSTPTYWFSRAYPLGATTHLGYHCCATPCKYTLEYSRIVTKSLDECCIACNLRSCNVLSIEERNEIMLYSAVYSPSKTDEEPLVVFIAV